jgi:hypothetical protein
VDGIGGRSAKGRREGEEIGESDETDDGGERGKRGFMKDSGRRAACGEAMTVATGGLTTRADALWRYRHRQSRACCEMETSLCACVSRRD